MGHSGRARLSLLIVLMSLVLAGAPPARAAAASTEWVPPLAGPLVVTAPFAPPADRYGSGHRGVDLVGAAGAPVRSAGDGVVTYAGLLAGRGVITVTHGALRTTYEPVSASVVVGETVLAGDEIGRLDPGHARCAPANCLHWGLRRGEDYLDPLRLLRRGPSRLLPWWDTGPTSAAALALTDAVAAPATAPAGPASPGKPAVEPVVASRWRLTAANAPRYGTAALALLTGLALLRRHTRRQSLPAPRDQHQQIQRE